MLKQILCVGFLVLIWSSSAHATDPVVTHVSNATALQTALTTAQSNGQNNVILLASGTYTAGSAFTYTSSATTSLSIAGDGDTPIVILNGSNDGLSIITNGAVTVSGISFGNDSSGNRTGLSIAEQNSSTNFSSFVLSVSNCRFSHNTQGYEQLMMR